MVRSVEFNNKKIYYFVKTFINPNYIYARGDYTTYLVKIKYYDEIRRLQNEKQNI